MTMLDLRCKSPLLHYNDSDLNLLLNKYNRTVDTLDNDVRIIREWLKTQKHLPTQPTDRQIITFLALNKFSFEETKLKLEMKFSIKSLLPEFYEYPPNHPKILEVSKAYIFCPLPKLSKDHNRVNISKCIDATKIQSFEILLTHILHIMELRLVYDCCDSDEYILDLENINFALISLFGPMELKKMVTIAERVYSSRIAAIHFINVPAYAETVINLLKIVIKDKIRERIFTHKDASSIRKMYPKEILPKEYGGDEKSIYELNDDMGKFLLEHNDFLEKIIKERVNEDLRPMKLDNNEILGFHGNFRKLDVD